MDAVVACGGDGTINRVLHGLMLRPAQTRPALGVLYAGTSPDFCRWHGIPTDPRDAVHALLQREPRTVDVMQITYRDATGGERVGYFGCSANLGIGARVAARANRWRPWLGDTLGTALAVVSTLAGRFPTLTVACNNGAPVTLPRCCNLTIAKNPELASGLRLGLPIAPDDGQAAVVGIHSRGPGRLLRLLPALYRGRIAEATGIFIATARDVHVTSSGFCPVEFDGDPQGQLPATLQVIPRAIHLLGTTHPGMSG